MSHGSLETLSGQSLTAEIKVRAENPEIRNDAEDVFRSRNATIENFSPGFLLHHASSGWGAAR
jgi:hypothetical protein